MIKGSGSMKLSIHGRKITLTDAIRKYAEEKISKVEKFNDSIIKIDATLAASKLKTGNAHVTEILAYLSGSTLKATATESDLYASGYRSWYVRHHQSVWSENGGRPHRRLHVRQSSSLLRKAYPRRFPGMRNCDGCLFDGSS